MKQFQFSLSSMLHYKDALLDKEKNTLMQLRVQQRTAEEKIERENAQLAALDREMKEKASEGTTIAVLKSFEFHQDNGRRLIRQLSAEFARITSIVERQREIVVALSQEVSGLEKLRDKQHEEYRYAEQKAEEVRIGEIVSSKYAAENPQA